MLEPLPVQTFGDIVRHGLELHVYCARCFALRRIDLERPALLDRGFATSRFRCARCGALGMPKVRPPAPLPVGGPQMLAFLWCDFCLWQIDHVPVDRPPWSRQRPYRCPGCRGTVKWHFAGPTWRPERAEPNDEKPVRGLRAQD
ncbi:hypothetical protein [Reyranella sp.]|uniref:hypothetical protein n=1 Tax=Reyranella sp. TaxID=1929291 RepID=UPI003BAB20D3